jgi:hypothetical protein
MKASDPGIWLMPTHNRVHTNLPRFINACKSTGMTTPLAIVVDARDYAENNEAYDALPLPDNWIVHVVPGGNCATATEQGFRDLCDGMKWVGWLADDLVPETPGWDVQVIEALNGWNCVSTDDGMYQGEKFNGATAWSGDLLRAVGYIYPEGLRHFYFDTAWEELGRWMNCWVKLKSVMVRHAHASRTGYVDQTTAMIHKAWDTDEAVFMKWKNEERLAAAERIGDLLIQYGVAKPLPDLSGVRVMIATPCGSGRYERLFMNSLFSTLEALRQCKATVNFVEMPYCSDVTLSRNKLFGTFLRSNATHMLFIDDDMGWRASDAIRLFSYQRDFVAVAGPRKTFPASFAAQNTDERGLPKPIQQEATTALIEVTDVGMAFCLLTRACCQRVADAHEELIFYGDDGRMEHGVFNPVVANKRYRSEDFSFCHRWRALSGKIYVDPNVVLEHVGSFVWRGDWMTQLCIDWSQQERTA